MQGFGKSQCQRGFSHSRHIFDQNMSPCKNRSHCFYDAVILSDDCFFDFQSRPDRRTLCLLHLFLPFSFCNRFVPSKLLFSVYCSPVTRICNRLAGSSSLASVCSRSCASLSAVTQYRPIPDPVSASLLIRSSYVFPFPP